MRVLRCHCHQPIKGSFTWETGQPELAGCRSRWSPSWTCRVAGGARCAILPDQWLSSALSKVPKSTVFPPESDLASGSISGYRRRPALRVHDRSLIVMKNSARTIGVALLAAAAGAGVALLLAPNSGERTRRLIRFKAESFAKDLRDEVNAGATALYRTGAASTRRALRRLGKAVKPIAA